MKLFQKNELKILWPFYLDSILSTILFFAPAFYIVYFRNLGFSLFEIGTLLAMPSAFALIFEIPTGAISDLFGRKKSVLIGIFFQAIALILLFFFTSFIQIAFIFAFIGFASTLISGANEAWTTDLINSKNKNLLAGFFTKSDSITSIGLIFSGLLGVFFVDKFGLKIIWPTAAFSLILSMIILSFAKETFIPKKTNIRNTYKSMKKQTKDSISYAYKDKVLFSILLAGVITSLGFTALEIGWVPLIQDLGLKDSSFGYLHSAMAMVGVIAPLISQKILKKGKERLFITHMLIFIILITFSIIFAVNLSIAILIILSLVFFADMRHPIQIAYFQKFVPSELRATIGSVKSMLLAATGIIAVPLAGLVIDSIGARLTISLSAFIAIPSAIIYYKIKDGKKINIKQISRKTIIHKHLWHKKIPLQTIKRK